MAFNEEGKWYSKEKVAFKGMAVSNIQEGRKWPPKWKNLRDKKKNKIFLTVIGREG